MCRLEAKTFGRLEGGFFENRIAALEDFGTFDTALDSNEHFDPYPALQLALFCARRVAGLLVVNEDRRHVKRLEPRVIRFFELCIPTASERYDGQQQRRDDQSDRCCGGIHRILSITCAACRCPALAVHYTIHQNACGNSLQSNHVPLFTTAASRVEYDEFRFRPGERVFVFQDAGYDLEARWL